MSKIESFQLHIKQLNRNRTVWVYLPTGYKKSGEPYPVIYMHDGQNLFYDHLTAYGRAWRVHQTLDDIAKRTGKKAIVVGVECDGDHRLSEYSPWKTVLPLTEFAPDNHGGEGDQYAQFFTTDLLCEIQSRYNVQTNRNARAIIGSSMGGLISLYIATKRQDLFETMGLFSPFTPFNESACYAFLNGTPQALSQHAVVYCGGMENISVSAQQMEQASIKLYNQLKSRNVKTELLFNSHFEHNEQAWDVYFYKFALDFLLRWYK